MAKKNDDPNANDLSTKEQKDQQRDPALQSYTGSGEGGKASDPDQNIIIEDDPRYQQGGED